MKIEELEKSDQFDTEKIKQCISDLEAVLQKYNFEVGELVLVYGNLGYKLGQNIAREVYNREFSGTPDIDELQKLYYSNPDIDISLMLSSLNTITWVDDLAKRERK